MLQQQEEEIFKEDVDRDRIIAIEVQDKELAKLLYEKVSVHSRWMLWEIRVHNIIIYVEW